LLEHSSALPLELPLHAQKMINRSGDAWHCRAFFGCLYNCLKCPPDFKSGVICCQIAFSFSFFVALYGKKDAGLGAFWTYT
jgi:hypothetical protein